MKMNIIAVNVQSDEPPYEISGRGIPITGIIPIVMPTFINRCMKRQLATQYPYIRVNASLDLSASEIIHHIRST